jgi:hypothetical protein
MRSRVVRVALVLALLGGTVAARAADGGGTSVRGVVLRPPVESARVESPSRYREHRPAGEPAEAIATAGCRCDPGRYAVVHLTGDSLPPIRLPLQPPSMAQKDRMFDPAVLAVPVGGEVTFPNLDPYFHNVFSYSKTRRFDLGRYPQGESASVVFERPGIVPVFCEIHYTMRAYIHVLDTPYFDVTGEDRRFEIADVRPGEYVLHVWQENQPEIRRPIVVGRAPVELEIP